MIHSIKGRILVLALMAPLLAPSARANIYATDIKGVNTDFGVNNITYVLNEPATLGVTIQISSGAKVLRVFTAPSGANGALVGSNSIVWDGKDSNGVVQVQGYYGISVTAASSGHDTWTQISHDTNAGNYVYEPRGLAVDNNLNSPYYGRIFLGNAGTGPHAATVPGDQVTIIKLNADGSFADEGPDGNGGYPYMEDLGDYGVPQKMRVGEDDRLYMMDLDQYEVASFDMLLTTNYTVLTPDNFSENPYWENGSLGSGVGWFSMDVTGANTTNGLLWLGQWDANGAGIWNWHLTNGAADPNDDMGNWVVAVGGSLGVAASGGLMVDTNFDIFTGQYLTDSGDTNADCMVFPHWNGGRAYGGAPVSNGVAWSAGGGDNTFLGVYDTTVDSRSHPNYVACALNGGPAGGIRILSAATGATVTNLDVTNQYYVTAWDNAGNLYAASSTSHRLRVFAPPAGTNQTTTTGSFEIGPVFSGIAFDGTNVTITFSDTQTPGAGIFTLQSSDTVNGAYAAVPGATLTQTGPGIYTFTAAAPAPQQFYQISETPAQ